MSVKGSELPDSITIQPNFDDKSASTVGIVTATTASNAGMPMGSETTKKDAVRPSGLATVADRPDDCILLPGTGIFIGAAAGAVIWAIAIYLIV